MDDSWSSFVARHARSVLTAAVRVLGNQADAEDLAQDVFVEIFRLERRAELADQPALVRTIATRRALDRLRRRPPTVALGDHDVQARPADPAGPAMASEFGQRLRGLLADLPPREGEVFYMASFEGLSHADIATALGISSGAVAKSLCLARAKLARALAQTDARSQT